MLHLNRNKSLPLHPHIILLLVKYTKLFAKILDQQWTPVNYVLKEILPLDTIKLSSRRDRNLKEMLAPSVPYAHRKDREVNQLDSCSRCGSQRCGLCKIGILVETNKFCSFTIRFKYRIFRPLNCISVNVIYKIDCILCKFGYIRSTSKQARTRWVEHKYDIKNSRIGQSGLTDHLHKGVHHNQSFDQKLGNLRMVLIDQVAGEIIVNNV